MRTEREVYEELLERGRQYWEEELPGYDFHAVQFYFDVDEFGFEEAVNVAKDEHVHEAYEVMGTPIRSRYLYRYVLMSRDCQKNGAYETHEEYIKDAQRAIQSAEDDDEWERKYVVKTGRLYDPADWEDDK